MDANRSVSVSWKGFPLLKEKPPIAYIWSGRILTKNKATARFENLWPEVWSKMRKAAQKKEKQECANEKPKLDNVRRLRGFYFIDPEDGENQETITKRKEKVGSSNGGGNALQNRTKKHLGFQETEARSHEFNKIPKHKACMRALWKLMNQRESVRNQYRKIMNITSQAKGIIRWLITF